MVSGDSGVDTGPAYVGDPRSRHSGDPSVGAVGRGLRRALVVGVARGRRGYGRCGVAEHAGGRGAGQVPSVRGAWRQLDADPGIEDDGALR